MDTATGGGGWAVNWVGSDRPAEVRRIGCGNRHAPGSSGLGERARACSGSRCRWNVRLRREGDEWRVARDRGTWAHNHPLLRAAHGLSSRAALRPGIPEDLMDLGRELRRAGLRAGSIHKALRGVAAADGRPVTWNLEDVRRAYIAPAPPPPQDR